MIEDSRIFIGLGSNISNRYNYISACLNILDKHPHIWIINRSYLYESDPMYNYDQKNFYNMVIEIQTNLEPLDLLNTIQNIERDLGRKSNHGKNMPRVIDIDILAIGHLVINSKILNIPHLKISERKFVLKPWNDIAPDFILPGINKNIYSILSDLNDTTSVNMICDFDNC